MCSCDKMKSSRSIYRNILAFFRNESGSAAVESSIVLTLLVTILFGAVESGRTFEAWNETGHALGRAVRVVNIDNTKTADEIATLIKTYLENTSTGEVTVLAEKQTISGTEFMNIEVEFPFDINIPFYGSPTLTLSVDTLAPIMSPLK